MFIKRSVAVVMAGEGIPYETKRRRCILPDNLLTANDKCNVFGASIAGLAIG